MRVDIRLALRGLLTRLGPYRHAPGVASAVIAMAILVASVSLAPPALADTADTAESLRAAVMSVRSASCGPLQSDPLVEQAAEGTNRLTDLWLDQDGRASPVDDPLPLLKDLGYGGDKAILLRGAAPTEADAIKGLLIQGYLDLPDCSYTDYGVSVMQNPTTNYILAAVVLAA